MPTYISHITTHNQQELKISYKCAMLVVIIYRDLKMGGSYQLFFVRLVWHASELILFVVYCSKLMLDYFGISNMFVNHAIVVIWVLLRAVFSETKILFSACFYLFGLWFLKSQIYHFYHY